MLQLMSLALEAQFVVAVAQWISGLPLPLLAVGAALCDDALLLAVIPVVVVLPAAAVATPSHEVVVQSPFPFPCPC